MSPDWPTHDEEPPATAPADQYPSWMKYGLRAVILLLALIAFLVWRASGGGQDCLITATGEKLCGQEAVAWCEATDGIREEAQRYSGETGTFDSTVSKSQAVCDSIRD